MAKKKYPSIKTEGKVNMDELMKMVAVKPKKKSKKSSG
jgi:hypothetical protein